MDTHRIDIVFKSSSLVVYIVIHVQRWIREYLTLGTRLICSNNEKSLDSKKNVGVEIHRIKLL